MTAWQEFSPADFDRSRARKGTRARSAEPGLFHIATPTERPGKSAPKTEPLPGEVALFGDETEEN